MLATMDTSRVETGLGRSIVRMAIFVIFVSVLLRLMAN
jgi:hypothetical protein